MAEPTLYVSYVDYKLMRKERDTLIKVMREIQANLNGDARTKVDKILTEVD